MFNENALDSSDICIYSVEDRRSVKNWAEPPNHWATMVPWQMQVKRDVTRDNETGSQSRNRDRFWTWCWILLLALRVE